MLWNVKKMEINSLWKQVRVIFIIYYVGRNVQVHFFIKKELCEYLFLCLDFEQAITLYSKGVDMCPKSYSKTLAMLYSNRAASYVKLVSIIVCRK